MLQWRVENYVRIEVDFVNQVIPYFFNKTDSYVLWWQTHLQSIIMKSLSFTTSEFNEIDGLVIRILIISIPTIILLIFAFNSEFRKFISIKNS